METIKTADGTVIRWGAKQVRIATPLAQRMSQKRINNMNKSDANDEKLYAAIHDVLYVRYREFSRIKSAIDSASRASQDVSFNENVTRSIIDALDLGDIEHVDDIYDMIKDF